MQRQTALVLLDRPHTPDMRIVARAIMNAHPGIAVSVPGDTTGLPIDLPLIACAGEFLSVTAVMSPVSQAVAKAPLSTGWPGAGTALACHQAHLVVSTIGKSDDPLHAARAATAVVGALVATAPGCAGVVWNGQVAVPVDRWQRMSASAFADYPDFPFMLWVGIRPFRDDLGIGAVTVGLSAFVHRELEFEGNGLDLRPVLQQAAGLAAGLIQNANAFRNAFGDGRERPFGTGIVNRLPISLGTSRRFSGLPVLIASAQSGIGAQRLVTARS
jgi:hypothetical protein